jgi:hypothetical protein
LYPPKEKTMAITLKEQHELSINGEFVVRIRQAAATVALEVLAEDPATLGGQNEEYARRLALAQSVLRDAPAAAQRAAYILATASPVTNPEAITDAQYLAFLHTNWSALSGYNPLYNPEA